MQTISASLTSEQLCPDQKYYRKVELYRRYWNGSAFVWDTALVIDSYVVKVSTAKWKLDTKGYNEWKSPSFQVDVDNRRNYWNNIEPTGVWKTGTHAPYYPELSRIRVRCGQTLPDGTQEDLYVFSGVINRPMNHHDVEKTITLYAAGRDEILRRVNAENLSTTVTTESLGVDSGTDFLTANYGVGFIDAVYKGATGSGVGAATLLVAGKDYQTAQLNDATLKGKVSLTVALTAGNSVWATYRYWYVNKDLSWIVTNLLTLAGETSYQVDPTIFSNDIVNSWLENTKAQWDAGTVKTNIDTIFAQPKMQTAFTIDDFAHGAQPGWTTPPTISSNRAVMNGAINSIAVANATLYGMWEFAMDPAGVTIQARFILANLNNYELYVDSSSLILRHRHRDAFLGDTVTNLLTISRAAAATDVYRVTRDNANLFTIYVNGSVVGTVTDTRILVTGINTGTFQMLGDASSTFGTIKISSDVTGKLAGTFESAIFDTGVGNPTSWGKVLSNYDATGGTVAFYTYSSSSATFASGNDPAGWVAISGTGQILSAVNRYIKVRAVLTPTTALSSPLITDITLQYNTTSTIIPLVNLSGLDVWSAIEQIAAMSSYEIGYNSQEKFFYRARSTSISPVLTIDHAINMEKELNFNDGSDQIKSAVDSSFGSYKVTIDANSQGEAHPNAIDIYGYERYSISSQLLPASSADVATSAGKTVYAYVSKARRRAQVQMKFFAQFEIGDPVLYKREHKFGRWLWGDVNKHYGDFDAADFVWYEPTLSQWDIPMRIEGIEFDTEPGKWRVRYDLTEIL